MPAPVRTAPTMYAPRWSMPTLKLGTVIAPAAALDDVEEAPLPPVPEGTLVTVPVPAAPAWLINAEQAPDALAAAFVVAAPPKLQAFALFCWPLAYWLKAKESCSVELHML